jgi:sugar O-acyltransferase (sialic acid O-acetyltransferase NeuD family)
LVGGGGLAREVLAAVRLLQNEWTPIGALDDDPSRHGADLDGVPVLGGSELIGEFKDAAVVACVANARRPEGRLTVVRRLGLLDDRWATIVHPSAFVPEGSVLGPGTVLLAGAVITTPLRIGAHVVAMPHVLITHDDNIADGVTFAGAASLGGFVSVGECAYLGQRCSVREKLSIGARAVVGMGAVVLQDVPAGEVWAGVPARRIQEARNV